MQLYFSIRSKAAFFALKELSASETDWTKTQYEHRQSTVSEADYKKCTRVSRFRIRRRKSPDLQETAGQEDTTLLAKRATPPRQPTLVSYWWITKDDRYPELRNNVSYDRPRHSISRRLCQAASLCSISSDG